MKKKRIPKKTTANDPLHTFLLNSVVEAKFVKESYTESNFLTQRYDCKILPPATNSQPRGVKSAKKEGIISKLVYLMPPNRRKFWLDLPVSENSLYLNTNGQIVSYENVKRFKENAVLCWFYHLIF